MAHGGGGGRVNKYLFLMNKFCSLLLEDNSVTPRCPKEGERKSNAGCAALSHGAGTALPAR